MSDPRPEFVARFEGRGLFWFLFLLTFASCGWFVTVIIGENQGYSDDPGRWALLPTFVWGLIGLAIMVLFIAYCLAVLTIRETDPRVYRTEDGGDLNPEPPTPEFLQPEGGVETPSNP